MDIFLCLWEKLRVYVITVIVIIRLILLIQTISYSIWNTCTEIWSARNNSAPSHVCSTVCTLKRRHSYRDSVSPANFSIRKREPAQINSWKVGVITSLVATGSCNNCLQFSCKVIRSILPLWKRGWHEKNQFFPMSRKKIRQSKDWWLDPLMTWKQSGHDCDCRPSQHLVSPSACHGFWHCGSNTTLAWVGDSQQSG